jgi:hypothetical protein
MGTNPSKEAVKAALRIIEPSAKPRKYPSRIKAIEPNPRTGKSHGT